MTARPFIASLCLWAGSALPLCAQQLVNGNFEAAFAGWTNNPFIQCTDCDVMDFDTDGDLEMVFFSSNLVAKDDNVLAVQDFPAEFMDLHFGVALSADICASNLNADTRAFTKLEFLDETNSLIAGAAVDGNILGPSFFATGNVCRSQVTLVRQARDLTNILAGAGKTLDEVSQVRATLFMIRFDTNPVPPTGVGYFDDVSFGRVSRSFDVPFVINGDFAYDDWWWRNFPDSSAAGWLVQDIDADGDKELTFAAEGLTNSGASLLWVQDLDATALDFTNGISLKADIGATNLSSQFIAFSKLEFHTNSPPIGGQASFELRGEDDPSTFATNNQTKLGVTLATTFENLTNNLAGNGAGVDDLKALRVTLFLLATSDGAASGFGWFDHVELEDVDYKDRPDVTETRLGNSIVLTWSSDGGEPYRVQENNMLSDFRWSNAAPGTVVGQAGTTSVTNPLKDPAGFFRVIRDR